MQRFVPARDTNHSAHGNQELIDVLLICHPINGNSGMHITKGSLAAVEYHKHGRIIKAESNHAA